MKLGNDKKPLINKTPNVIQKLCGVKFAAKYAHALEIHDEDTVN